MNWKQRRRAAPQLIMNQLIPLQMMDPVAMTTDAMWPREWRRGLFPRIGAVRVDLGFCRWRKHVVHVHSFCLIVTTDVRMLQVHEIILAIIPTLSAPPPMDVTALGTC